MARPLGISADELLQSQFAPGCLDELNRLAYEALRELGDLRGLKIYQRRFLVAKRLKKVAAERGLQDRPNPFLPAIYAWASSAGLDPEEEAGAVYAVWVLLKSPEGGALLKAYIQAVAKLRSGGGLRLERNLFPSEKQHWAACVIAGIAQSIAKGQNNTCYLSCRKLAGLITCEDGSPLSKSTINSLIQILKNIGFLRIVQKPRRVNGNWLATRYAVADALCNISQVPLDTDPEIQNKEIPKPEHCSSDAKEFLKKYPRKDCQQAAVMDFWEEESPPLETVLEHLVADLPRLLQRKPDMVPGPLTYLKELKANDWEAPVATDDTLRASLEKRVVDYLRGSGHMSWPEALQQVAVSEAEKKMAEQMIRERRERAQRREKSTEQ